MCTFKLSLSLQTFSLPLVASRGGWLEGWTLCDEQGPSLRLSLTWLWSEGGILCWVFWVHCQLSMATFQLSSSVPSLNSHKEPCDKRYFTDKETQATR